MLTQSVLGAIVKCAVLGLLLNHVSERADTAASFRKQA